VADFAREIDAPSYQAARKMFDRDSIADSYWDATVDAARKRNIRNAEGKPLSVNDLARMKAARRKRADVPRRKSRRSGRAESLVAA
jgi:hypothetical protein